MVSIVIDQSQAILDWGPRYTCFEDLSFVIIARIRFFFMLIIMILIKSIKRRIVELGKFAPLLVRISNYRTNENLMDI